MASKVAHGSKIEVYEPPWNLLACQGMLTLISGVGVGRHKSMNGLRFEPLQ